MPNRRARQAGFSSMMTSGAGSTATGASGSWYYFGVGSSWEYGPTTFLGAAFFAATFLAGVFFAAVFFAAIFFIAGVFFVANFVGFLG